MSDPAREAHVDDIVADLHRVLLVSSRRLRSRAASDEVSVAQFSVLAYLHREGEATPGRVADFERVSPPVMTRIIARLEEAGWVARRPHPGDRRQVLLALTEAGATIVEEGRRARSAWLRERVDGLDDTQLGQLETAARMLRDVLLDAPREGVRE
ncbi:MarR family winged helix-turn-helix transcriptional regulator [Brachybacterium kimchii]|uniref:MarR family transcriptional regulator n=1 Tax=Brachybacterium kimchii TaxID=2942909 RepID=A0ABY4NB58_9MICO|nr:MarR family transcriptional regulator [Brachybacterium kimchii]UQN31012.1 MarR family transcriptional regulator [Brachybacterium kimchii]